jgi:hypothetical protein
MTSPPIFRASVAAELNVEAARSASTRAALSGFPASAEIVRAMSSRCSATSAAVRASTSARR